MIRLGYAVENRASRRCGTLLYHRSRGQRLIVCRVSEYWHIIRRTASSFADAKTLQRKIRPPGIPQKSCSGIARMMTIPFLRCIPNVDAAVTISCGSYSPPFLPFQLLLRLPLQLLLELHVVPLGILRVRRLSLRLLPIPHYPQALHHRS